MCKEICSLLLSRPSRGAWIEIATDIDGSRIAVTSRPSRGAWIEIPTCCRTVLASRGRAPRGARGLKYKIFLETHSRTEVAPLAGRVD